MIRTIGLAAALAAASAALANDSTATTAAGGLVLRQSADIDMVSEDLFVSVEQVRVITSSATAPPATSMSPSPSRCPIATSRWRPKAMSVFRPISTPSWPASRSPRRSNAHILARGVDRTALLQGLHIPLAPDADGTERIVAALTALPPARRANCAGSA